MKETRTALTTAQMGWYMKFHALLGEVTAYTQSVEYWAHVKHGEEKRREYDLKRKKAENTLADWVIANPYPSV